MRPAASTAVASIINSPAPPSDSEPRCCRCQSLALPSSALYWHIGETTMRLAKVNWLSAMGVNSGLGMSGSSPWLGATLSSPAPAPQRRRRRGRNSQKEGLGCGTARPRRPACSFGGKGMRAGLTQGSSPPRGLSGRCGRAADAITARRGRRDQVKPLSFRRGPARRAETASCRGLRINLHSIEFEL